MLLSKCSFCSRQNQELQIIFKQLRNKFERINSSLLLKLSQEEEVTPEMDGFQHLLRVLNINNNERKGNQVKCKHIRYFKYFLKLFRLLKKSLNCNSQTLNYLCQITANILAEKNYALSLLESQVNTMLLSLKILVVISQASLLKHLQLRRKTPKLTNSAYFQPKEKWKLLLVKMV